MFTHHMSISQGCLNNSKSWPFILIQLIVQNIWTWLMIKANICRPQTIVKYLLVLHSIGYGKNTSKDLKISTCNTSENIYLSFIRKHLLVLHQKTLTCPASENSCQGNRTSDKFSYPDMLFFLNSLPILT